MKVTKIVGEDYTDLGVKALFGVSCYRCRVKGPLAWDFINLTIWYRRNVVEYFSAKILRRCGLKRIKLYLQELAFRNCTNHFILLQYSCGIYSKINLKNHFNVGVFLLLSFSKPILCGSSSNRVLSSTMFWILIHFPIMQKTSARCTKPCIMEQE